MFKFSQALVIAAVLVGFAYLNSQLTHQRIFLIVLYLLLATIVPWLMVPLGLVAVLWSLYKSPSIVTWFQQVTGANNKVAPGDTSGFGDPFPVS